MLGAGLSKEIINFFMNMPIFDRINAEELRVVARQMSAMEIAEGDVLFSENDKGNYVCFIVEGKLDVVKKSEATGKDVVLASLGKGQSIGEMSIVADAPRSATIVARSDTSLYILSKSAFDLILEKHPRVGIKILKGISRLLSENLRETSNRLADYMPPLS